MRLSRILATALAAVVVSASVLADVSSPVGLWKTVDDRTGKERALVRITETNGVYEGRVEKIFDQPGDDPQHLCRKCQGERKDQPIVGMTILWDMKQEGDRYGGGQILDAKEGKTYRCRMRLLKDRRELEVRGYIGVSMFGRSQTWIREQS